MKTVCAWCQKVLKEGSEERISHGICLECAKEQYPDLDLSDFENKEECHA